VKRAFLVHIVLEEELAATKIIFAMLSVNSSSFVKRLSQEKMESLRRNGILGMAYCIYWAKNLWKKSLISGLFETVFNCLILIV
jgi:hypothetical protein